MFRRKKQILTATQDLEIFWSGLVGKVLADLLLLRITVDNLPNSSDEDKLLMKDEINKILQRVSSTLEETL